MLSNELSVVAGIFADGAVFYTDYTVAHGVEKVGVMRNNDISFFYGNEIFFQPFDMLDVQEVGRLVQKHYVGIFENELCQHNFGSLPARQRADDFIQSECGNAQASRNLFNARIYLVKAFVFQLFEHAIAAVYHLFEFFLIGYRRHFLVQSGQFFINVVQVIERRFEIFHNSQATVDVGVLIEIVVSYAAVPYNLAFVITYITGDDVDKSTLAGTVKSDNADVFAVVDVERSVFEKLFVLKSMRQVVDFKYAQLSLLGLLFVRFGFVDVYFFQPGTTSDKWLARIGSVLNG